MDSCHATTAGMGGTIGDLHKRRKWLGTGVTPV